MDFHFTGLSIKNIGHLGLIVVVFKEQKLVERIDEMLAKTSKNVRVSTGQAVMAMVMQGHGYSNNQLSFSTDFYSQVGLGPLFDERIVDYKHLNAFTFGRTLDAQQASPSLETILKSLS